MVEQEDKPKWLLELENRKRKARIFLLFVTIKCKYSASFIIC
jgi:hypothetical protein